MAWCVIVFWTVYPTEIDEIDGNPCSLRSGRNDLCDELFHGFEVLEFLLGEDLKAITSDHRRVGREPEVLDAVLGHGTYILRLTRKSGSGTVAPFDLAVRLEPALEFTEKEIARARAAARAGAGRRTRAGADAGPDRARAATVARKLSAR